jgi:hypothetical protein
VNQLDPATASPALHLGLLMETAEAQQRAAERQIEKLMLHTRDLDAVVRDEIRQTLVEELRALHAETERVTRAMRAAQRIGAWRAALLSLLPALLCALLPWAVTHWALPSERELAVLRSRRAELTTGIAVLEARGAKTVWRRCGEQSRLCVRVDRTAPVYGEHADYYVLDGY